MPHTMQCVGGVPFHSTSVVAVENVVRIPCHDHSPMRGIHGNPIGALVPLREDPSTEFRPLCASHGSAFVRSGTIICPGHSHS
jgi:hypothetical protein